MARLLVDDDTVRLELSRREKLGSLHGDVVLPRSSVVGAVVVDRPFDRIRGLRAPGTAVPRVIAIGTWRRWGGKDFVAVRRGHRGVQVDLDGADLDRLLVSCDDPETVVAALTG